MRHKTAKKMFALAVCVLFIGVTLFSAAFVHMHLHHEHDHNGPGGNCAVCTYLAVAGNVLKLLTGVLVCGALGSGKFAVVRSTLEAVYSRTVLFTLVQQKIKLNN